MISRPAISHFLLLLLLLFLSPLCGSPAADFPPPTDNQAPLPNLPKLSAKDALAKMHLPPGFKATVFASEPDVQQPIACCWDEKGRLWVAENYTYSDSKERFDMKLRDRILIFEDTDNDGVHDKRTVFADDLQMLTSIERGFGGVYAMCPPHLLFIPAKDDKPTGPPQVLLDGFSTTAASRHTFANGLKWGPDGWLYGRIGISSTSWIDVPGTPQEKRQPTAGGIWRYHPVRKLYEPYCHGTTNPWGMDWDENGEMFFINTVIGHFFHGIRGAHFKRMHGEDPYDHIYGLIDQHADHYHWDTGKSWTDSRDGAHGADALGGGHAHVGMMIYQGTNWPKEYRGKVFTLNLHGRRVNVERLEREGSGYVARHEPDMFKTDDPWFRGIEITYGPDGGVYILDWSDIGECHENDGVHRTSGRIYKITYGDAVRPRETDVSALDLQALLKLQLSDNEWLARMARWELRERAAQLKPGPEQMQMLLAFKFFDDHESQATPRDLLRFNCVSRDFNSVTTKNYTGGVGDGVLYGSRDDELIRLQKIRQFTDMLPLFLELRREWIRDTIPPGTAQRLQPATETTPPSNNKIFLPEVPLKPSDAAKANPPMSQVEFRDLMVTLSAREFARSPTTPRLRLALASALQSLPQTKWTFQLQTHLLSHAEDATDHNLPLMYWFGIRDLPPAELVKLFPDCQIPLVRQFITRRITEDLEKNPAPLNTLLSGTGSLPVGPTGSLPVASSNVAITTDILTGMTAALKGWRKAKKPEAWDNFVAKLSSPSDSTTKLIRDLNVLFGDGRALDEVRAIALDSNADPEARRSALQTLIEAKAPEARDFCLKFLSDRSLGLTAVQGLATFDDPDLANRIVARYKNFYPHERSAVLTALVSRPAFAKVLLERVAKGEVPRADITPIHARQVRSFNDDALTKKLTEVWGELRDSSEDKKKLIATLKSKLTPDALSKADQGQGRFLYASVCASCHKLYGEGLTIGPDLTGSGRHNVDYLIENIADPSAVVAADYKMTVLTLKDGRVLNGIIHTQTDRTLTLAMVGQELTIDRGDIIKQEQLPVSMMPEGLAAALSDTQLRDLFSYLMGTSQVPLPSAQ